MKKFLEYFILGFALFIALLGVWVRHLYGEITFEQLVFHLNLPLLKGGINSVIVWNFSRYCILPLLVFLILYYKLEKKFLVKTPFIKKYLFIALLFGFGVWAQERWGFDKLYHQSKIASSYGDFYENHYITPQKANLIFPKHKRNLILLVVESLESTYSNPKFANPTLTPNLLKIAQENITFRDTDTLGGGGIQAYGVSWTIAGLSAYHCGIPLRLPVGGNNFSNTFSFLGGAVCLGDILDSAGYKQLALIPHHRNFSGIGSFYQTHKISVKDSTKLPQNKGFWDINDFTILNEAKKELIKLAQSNQPFALNILTLDTHAKEGYLDPIHCKNLYGNQNENSKYKNAISCTDSLIGEFIDWVSRQDFYKDTTIVILGDHLTMNTDFIPQGIKQRIYNAFINPHFYSSITNLKNRSFSHFDLFPTILDSLDVEIRGGELGLGTTLLGKQKTLLESGEFEEEILKNSKVYEDFLYKQMKF